jgi:tRNA A-37 threonylcarbamoyl transferase component Bud32
MTDTSSGVVGGRYRVLGSLGKGAMGLVFMAYDPVLDRKVAIKQMTAEIADSEELRKRFYIEARAAARLNHPNIITIHELHESGGDIFMIMELLEGKSLAALVQAKPVPLSIEATIDVMAQVCDGLDYAHQRAIVHRDIKPANLFLAPSGTVKILDFGIARLGSMSMTAAGALIGTPDYMSPEQIRGDEIDRRTDLWAIGAVLYQLLSGTKPFEGKPLAKLLTAIAQTPHAPLVQRAPSVPRGLSDLVDRLLSKPRDGRPANAGLVRDELRAILGRESSASTKATLAEDGYEETVFMAVPPKAVPPKAPVAAPPVSPPAPPAAEVDHTVLIHAAEVKPPAPTRAGALPTSARPAAPASAGPPPLPPPPASKPVAVPPPARMPIDPGPKPAPPAKPAPQAVPAPRSSATPKKLPVVALIAVVVLALIGAAAAWWYFGGRPSPAPDTGEPTATQGEAPSVPGQAAPPTQPAAVETAPPVGAAAGAELATTPPGAPPSTPASDAGSKAPPQATPAPQRPPSETKPPDPQPAPAAAVPAANAPRVPAAPDASGRKPTTAAPVETGVSGGAEARPGVSGETVDAFRGRTSGQGGDPAARLAAVNRINYVLEQYVRALVNGDAETIRDYRASLSPEESALMRARQLKVRLEELRVEVDGSEAVARCRRRLEGTSATGARIQEDGPVTFHLTRRPSGWVITDVK